MNLNSLGDQRPPLYDPNLAHRLNEKYEREQKERKLRGEPEEQEETKEEKKEIKTELGDAFFLEGDFGKDILNEYNARVKRDYCNIQTLTVLKYEYDKVKGSNLFAAVLINGILRDQGMRPATPADLERIIKTNALDLRGTYEDAGLVLRSRAEPNFYLARDLMKQVRAREPEAKMPVMIPLSGFNLALDGNSNYGLSFKLREDAEIIHAPILNSRSGSYINPAEIDEKTGLPTRVYKTDVAKTDRQLWTSDSGLSRLYLGRHLGWVSWDIDLSSSFERGEVVCIRSGAVTK